MLLFIDYDNIEQSERRLGLDHILRKAVSLIDYPLLNLSSVRARLYGGWYEGGTLTRQAQNLAAELRGISPVRYISPYASVPILVRGELATSILAAPRALINNTFRRRGFPRNLRCERRPWLSCVDNSRCPLIVMERFLDNDYCDTAGCSVRPNSILHKEEQKVVDSMIVADLIQSATESAAVLAVVSRDDDIWPGLFMASKGAQALIHISTSRAARVPAYYGSLSAPPYRRVNWS